MKFTQYAKKIFFPVHLIMLSTLPVLFDNWHYISFGIFFYLLTSQFGFELGFHRYLTHRSFKMKEWKRDGYDNQGIKHDAGTLKRTWECIRDDGLYSYKIDQNPQYADAMRTMYASKKVR